MASSSSSSSSMPTWEYDVFLSFHGKDTRNDFVACLHMFLSDLKGFRIFKDDEELERGKSISPELLKNINESRIAVIVFSENYASSSWCLDELVEIVKCRTTKKQIVLPLFYDVEPSDVRNQTGKFGEAFTRKHEGIRTADELERWRKALKETAGISGLELQVAANGNWPKFFQQIGQEISPILQLRTLKVAEYQVGIDSRASELIMLLNDSSEDKFFVGIWGTGGIGKTTVAKAVFNSILNKFERSCFLNNVREESTNHGLAKLQEELLKKTLMDNDIRISDIDVGIKEIEKRLQNEKILIVLDDVDDEKQLLNLAGIGHNWFSSGSRIIITTRNKWLLEKHDVKIWKAELLDDDEALELFSWHAFKKKCPEAEFLGLSNCVKDYAQNLPLALQVLGSHLCQRSKAQWESELDILLRNPPKEVQDVLKISFNGLHEEERSIFLDIACFFKRCDINIAMDSFKSSKSLSETRIKVLIERSLVTIEYNTFLMHDLIQKMGREIVRQESKDSAKRSRLWLYEDICEVFDGDTVPKNIEGIMLTEVGEEGLIVKPNVLLMMKKLRILIISTDVKLHGCPESLPNQLRCFKWEGYPGECLPLPKSLVRLELQSSHFKQIPLCENYHRNLEVIDFSFCKSLAKTLNFYELPCLKELNLKFCQSVVEVEFHSMMKNLRHISLSYCDNLKKSPNFSRLPCLEKLDLEWCESLVEVDPSIEFHERLVELDFRFCRNLKSFATRIHLKSLRSLLLNNCYKFEKFPEIQGDMECLDRLSLTNAAIKELPSSFKHLKSLHNLNLSDCGMLGSLPSNIGGMETLMFLNLEESCIRKLPSSIAQLTQLVELKWNNCNLDEESILNLPHSLEKLYLRRNNFASLPASFTQLAKLEYLDLDGCLSLQTLESLPSSIKEVSAQGCVSLERYSVPTSGKWKFTESHKLKENHGKNKPNIYSESLLQDIGDTFILLPGGEIPSWFNHTWESGEDPFCLVVDPNSCTNLKGIAVCAVIGFDHRISYDYYNKISLVINGYLEVDLEMYYHIKSRLDHIMLSHRTHPSEIPSWLMVNSEPWYIEAFTRNDVPLKVKKWGIHLVMDLLLPPPTQVYTDQATNKRKRKRTAQEDR